MSEPTTQVPMTPSLAGTPIGLTVLIPVSERPENVVDVYRAYLEQFDAIAERYEVIFVMDGPQPAITDKLRQLRGDGADIQIVTLNRWFGEATALAVGFDRARGDIIVTLPSYFQVEPEELPKMVATLRETDSDLVTAWRHPRIDSLVNRLQSAVFHGITRFLTAVRFHDISCGLRVMKRRVAEEIALYGDLHRFFPLLAYQRGFRITEVQVRQSTRDVGRRLYRPGLYLRRLLDLLTLFFIFKFTKKPLRFFGLVGTAIFAVGAAITGYLGVYRILGLGPIAGRPLLILGVLLLVLGVQLFSIGLLGEIIIFTHARNIRDYEFRDVED